MPDQVLGARDVAGLARRELDEDRSALGIDEGVELGGEPASGTTQTAIDTPLFAVAPCWWTRTTDVSIIWTSPS
jgi:hypothetical protein